MNILGFSSQRGRLARRQGIRWKMFSMRCRSVAMAPGWVDGWTHVKERLRN